MKTKRFTILLPGLVLLLTTITTSLSLIPDKAYAAAPYLASDVLGQVDFDSDTRYGENPNSQGFSHPYDIALDSVGHRLFVADTSNNRILIFDLDSNNELIDETADNIIGAPDFTTVTGGATASTFTSVTAISYDSDTKYLYALDGYNNRVLVFDTTTVINGEDAVYVLGQANFTDSDINNGNGTSVNAKGFWSPSNLFVDASSNRLFVSDPGAHRVLVFDTGSIANNMDASYVLGQANFTTSSSDTNQNGFNFPYSIAYDPTSQYLFVSDSANRILVFNVSTVVNNEPAIAVLGQADYTSSGSDLNAQGLYSSTAQAMDFDDVNNLLYVADGFRILVFDTGVLSEFNETAVNVVNQPDFTTNAYGTTAKLIKGPYGILHDPTTDNLYVVDSGNNRILVFDVETLANDQEAFNVIGQSSFTDNWQQNEAPGTDMFYISSDGAGGNAIDTVHHRLFVNDTTTNRILVFNLDADNNLIDKSADYVLGQEDFNSSEQETDQDSLYIPGEIAYDSVNDRLFVSDTYNNCRIMIFDTTSITNGEDAVVVLGEPDFDSNNCNMSVNEIGYGYYGGVSYDEATGYLYVSDGNSNNRVLVFDVNPSNPDYGSGMDASFVLGAPDFDTQGGYDPTINQFRNAYYGSILVDSASHRLFVSDSERIVVFDTSNLSNGMDASYVLGCMDFECNDYAGEAGSGRFTGMGYDPQQKLLFVGDTDNTRILIFDVNAITNGEDAVGVIGQTDFGSSDSGTSQSLLNFDPAENSAFDSANRRLYFSDGYNNRILIYDLANITLGDGTDTPATIPNATFGVPYDYELPIDGTQGTVTCELTDGTLPQGMSITSDCHIKGTPASNTVYTFTVTVTDDNGAIGTFSDSQVLGLTVNHASGELVDTGGNMVLPVLASVGAITAASLVGGRRRASKRSSH